MKGFSDFLYDEDGARVVNVPGVGLATSAQSCQDLCDELNCNKMNNYYLISNSKQIECFIIDKDSYIRNLNLFNNDKKFIDSFLDHLTNKCPKLPTNAEIDQSFVQHLNWNVFKKRVYNEQLNRTLQNKNRLIKPSNSTRSNNCTDFIAKNINDLKFMNNRKFFKIK